VWLSCAAKRCCERGNPEVTTADVVRIARALAIEPWTFVELIPIADDAAGVEVDQSGQQYRQVLATGAAGCVFLIRTSIGAGRCGLGELAPAACRVFPADPAAAEVTVRTSPGCVCREWTVRDLDAEELTGTLAAARTDRAESRALVERWNAYVRRAGSEAAIAAEDFLRYALHAQSMLDSGGRWSTQ
jgi:hypothetical protein